MEVMYYVKPYMVKHHAKIPRIQSIFEKEKHGHYAGEASLYRDILLYPLKTGNKDFKLSQLGLWLIDKNKGLPDFYGKKGFVKHTPKKNRFANVRDRIEAYLRDLVSLNLLYVTKIKAEKSGGPTDLYTYSGDGHFVARLIERTEPKEHNKSNEILFDLIQSTLTKHDSRHFVFLSRLYQKCKEKGMLDKAFDLLESILCEHSDINSVFEAIDLVPKIETTDPSIHRQFHDITLETLNSSDYEVRISQLFLIKSLLENRILKQYPPEVWEDLRRDHLNDYSTVVLHGKCHLCLWQGFVDVDTNQFVNVHIKNAIHGDCPACQSDASLHVTTELPGRPIQISNQTI